MNLNTFHNAINRLDKEILDLDKKIALEEKKMLDKEKQIISVERSITKNTSISSRNSKLSQIQRYKADIINIRKKVIDYQKSAANKRISLNNKKRELQRAEDAENKRERQRASLDAASRARGFSSLGTGRNIALSEEEYADNGILEDVNRGELIEKEDSSEEVDKPDKIFVSYSWDGTVHEEKVIALTNHLRENGFGAVIDKMLSQEETAINFKKMMYQAIGDNDKVIVVLSKGYKEKADSFRGGVGQEYELLISDISDRPNKYILVSFEGRGDDVIPFGLKDRDVVDLSNKDGMLALFEKLMGHQRYNFSPVASAKPVLPVKKVVAFAIEEKVEVISINLPVFHPTGDSSSFGAKYKFVDLALSLSVTNNSGKLVTGFGYKIGFRKELDPENYYNSSDGFLYFEEEFSGKLFPSQTRELKKFVVKVASQNIYQILGSKIFVSIYTEDGPIERDFLVDDLIRITPPNSYGEAEPISREMFI